MAEVSAPVVLPRSLATKARSATSVNRISKGGTVSNSDTLSVVDGNTVRTLRDTNRIIEALRISARLDGTLSTALYDLVQVANTNLRLKAYDSTTHAFSPEGTAIAKNILAMMDTLYDYTEGYADRRSVNAVKETALRECVLTGAVAGELVLDKQRFPDRIQIVPFETIYFVSDGNGNKHPVQRGLTPQEVDLDIPNFWVVESHLGADSPYPRSMLEASLSTMFYYAEFIEDMRRVVRRTGHSRLVMTLDAERVRLAAPEAAKKTEEAMRQHMELVRDELQTIVSSLEPEDALVVYDVAKGEDLSGKGEKADYTDLLQVLAGMAATSLKSHPSILGLRLQGSQSLSNTESLIFLQVAKAAQQAVSGFMSRALTLAARLYGTDVYVQVKFAPINLRPEEELEAFRTMRQDRILDLVSIGYMSDEEAVEELELPPRPAGAEKLSGTFFRDSASKNRAAEATPNSDPMGQAMTPQTPKKGGGRSQ
jgi:hypothetical protein